MLIASRPMPIDHPKVSSSPWRRGGRKETERRKEEKGGRREDEGGKRWRDGRREDEGRKR